MGLHFSPCHFTVIIRLVVNKRLYKKNKTAVRYSEALGGRYGNDVIMCVVNRLPTDAGEDTSI